MKTSKIPGIALTTQQKKDGCPVRAKGEVPTCTNFCFFCPYKGE